MSSKTYQDLVAWQKGIDLCEMVYRASAAFPRHEVYGLTSQIPCFPQLTLATSRQLTLATFHALHWELATDTGNFPPTDTDTS